MRERPERSRPERAGSPGSLLTASRLRRWLVAVAMALWAGLAVTIVTADGLVTLGGGRLGGDFPAFFGAGRILLEDPAGLADLTLQLETIGRWIPAGESLLFPYPFPAAWPYAALALLSYPTAYAVSSLLLSACLVVAGRWLAGLVPGLSEHRVLVIAGVLAFLPSFLAVAGGQNAPITLAVLTGAFFLLERERPVSAGGALAALWFKPQFLLPVVALLMLSRAWRTMAAALAGGLAWYAAGIPWWGAGWPIVWLDEIVSATSAANVASNTVRSVSVVELLRGAVGEQVAAAVAVVLAGVVAWLWLRADSWAERLAVAGSGLLLTAPHALFYELSLLLPAFGVLGVAHGRDGAILLGAIVLTAAVTSVTVPWIGAVAVLATVAWLARDRVRRPGPAPT